MARLLFSLVLLGASAPECKNAFGRTQCGYRGVAAYGQLRCAQTPGG